MGDSHTQALKKAQGARPSDVQEKVQFDINWLMTKKGDTIRGNLPREDAKIIAASLTPSDAVVLTIAGTLHNIFGLLRHERPFDLLDPEEKDGTILNETMLVPANVLWDLFHTKAGNNQLIKDLREAAYCPVYHLSTPPPKEDNQYIEARVVRYRERQVSEVGINSSCTRLKLWKLEMRVLEQLCIEWGMLLLPPPAGSQTAEGYLKHEFYADDATHANAAYGELVLKQLENIGQSNIRDISYGA